MDRYLYTDVTGSKNRHVQVYGSTRYPFIKPTQEDVYIFTRTGDRLDNLAHQYYNDSGLWWVLALVNNLGKGSFAVPVAIQLRIPSKKSLNDLLSMLKDASTEI